MVPYRALSKTTTHVPSSLTYCSYSGSNLTNIRVKNCPSFTNVAFCLSVGISAYKNAPVKSNVAIALFSCAPITAAAITDVVVTVGAYFISWNNSLFILCPPPVSRPLSLVNISPWNFSFIFILDGIGFVSYSFSCSSNVTPRKTFFLNSCLISSTAAITARAPYLRRASCNSICRPKPTNLSIVIVSMFCNSFLRRILSDLSKPGSGPSTLPYWSILSTISLTICSGTISTSVFSILFVLLVLFTSISVCSYTSVVPSESVLVTVCSCVWLIRSNSPSSGSLSTSSFISPSITSPASSGMISSGCCIAILSSGNTSCSSKTGSKSSSNAFFLFCTL